jgi:hypothetical protein
MLENIWNRHTAPKAKNPALSGSNIHGSWTPVRTYTAAATPIGAFPPGLNSQADQPV